MLLETPLGLALLALFGLLTGTLAGILGIGGGLLLVPALIFAGVETTLQATATSLIGVFLSATSGSIRNLKAGQLKWKASLGLAGFGIITAQIGAWLGTRVSDAVLSLGFASLLLITIYLMGLKKRLAARNGESEAEAKEKSGFQLLPIAGIGLTAGLLSGLFGVGGGVVMVPLQMLILGEDIKAAVRTSLGAIVAIAASGLIQHTAQGNVLWLPGLVLGVGGIIGAQFGTRLLPALPDRAVSILFRILLIALAIYMIIRTLQG